MPLPPLTCNIDSKGKAIRLIYGVILVVLGLVLIGTWARSSGAWWAWTVSLLTVGSGAFAIFEGRSGWCVIRAMGFKTRF